MATNDERGDDWAAKATAGVETLVEAIRDRSVKPVLFVAKAIVAGLVALAIGTVVLVTAVAGVVRLFDVDVFSNRVWATDFLIGGILVAAGAFLWKKSTRTEEQDARG